MPDHAFELYVMNNMPSHGDTPETWIFHVPVDGYNILLTVWKVPNHPDQIVMANGATPTVKPPEVHHDINWQDLPDDMSEELFNAVRHRVMADG